MDASLSVQRQVADPNISIADLMKVFQIYVVQNNNYDFLELVSCPGHCQWSWKTSPNPSWMCQMHRLVSSLLNVAPNGVLPPSKVRTSLMKLCELMRINKSRSSNSDWADRCDQRIRIVMAQYRLVKNKPYEYQRLMKKATPEEKACIDKALGLLAMDGSTAAGPPMEDGSTAAGPGGDGVATKPSSELALVPYVPPGNDSSAALSSKTNIFSRILSKQDSSPEQKKKMQHSLPLLQNSAPSAGQDNFQRKNATFFVSSAAAGFCVPGDDTVSEVSKASPVKKKKRKSKTGDNKPSSSSKKQSTASACKDDLSEDDLELVGKVLETEIPSSKGTKAKKKPAAAKAVAKQKAKQKSNNNAKKLMSGKGKKKSEKEEADQRVEKKTTFRHRATSTAYHQAKCRAKQQGLSHEEALAAGRTASRKVGEDIDNGLLKDPDASEP